MSPENKVNAEFFSGMLLSFFRLLFVLKQFQLGLRKEDRE